MTSSSDDLVQAVKQIARDTRGSILNRSLLLALILVAIDVLLVARLQQPSALAILQYTPPVTLFTGVLVNLLAVLIIPAVIMLLTVAAIAAAQGDFSKASSSAIGAILLYAGGAILLDRSVLMNPAIMAMLAMVGLLAILVFHTVGRARSWSIDRSFAALIIGAIGLVALGLTLGRDEVRIAISRPYLPAERLELNAPPSADESIEIGYVLNSSDDGHWTTVLSDDTREIWVVRSDSIVSRVICRPEGISSSNPWWSIVDTPATEITPGCD